MAVGPLEATEGGDKIPDLHPQGEGYLNKILNRDVLLAPLNPPIIGSSKPCFCSKTFLRKALKLPHFFDSFTYFN